MPTPVPNSQDLLGAYPGRHTIIDLMLLLNTEPTLTLVPIGMYYGPLRLERVLQTSNWFSSGGSTQKNIQHISRVQVLCRNTY